MKSLLVLLGVVLGAAAAHAGAPNPICLQTCRSAPGVAFAVCKSCEAFNVCSDLYHTDRPAYDKCMADLQQCHQEAHTCVEGRTAGYAARDVCPRDSATCCIDECTGELEPPHATSPIWFFFDSTMAPVFRHLPGDFSLRFAIRGELELLFGSSSWRRPRLPFRIGPFISGGAIVGGDDPGAQFAGGLTALVWGKPDASGTIGSAVLVSGGVLYDMPPDAPNDLGGLARVSVGITTTGRSVWKPVSIWLFLEGHWIPDDAGDRQEILLGVRSGPATLVFLLIPGAGDR